MHQPESIRFGLIRERGIALSGTLFVSPRLSRWADPVPLPDMKYASNFRVAALEAAGDWFDLFIFMLKDRAVLAGIAPGLAY